MSELKDKLANLLIQGGKYLSIIKENEKPIIVDCWHKKDESTMLLYNKNDKDMSTELSLVDVEDIHKTGYKKYIVSYLSGSLVVLKFRDRPIE